LLGFDRWGQLGKGKALDGFLPGNVIETRVACGAEGGHHAEQRNTKDAGACPEMARAGESEIKELR
jgi:hypothetical protein